MSLQGTFDTLSVAELFGLLSTAGKTGALRLEGADADADAPEGSGAGEVGFMKAAVFVAAGACCGVESDDVAGPTASAPELATRLVDVGFSLARCRSGSFRFADAEHPPFDVTVTSPLEPAVVEIEALLVQWQEIEATIPSLDARVRLAPVLHSDDIILMADEWRLLVALEGMPSVRELVARQGRPMIDVCRAVKGLVDRGAIEIGTEVVPEIREVRVDADRRRSQASSRPEAAVAPAAPPSPSPPAIAAAAIEVAAPYAPDAVDPADYDDDRYDRADDAVTAAGGAPELADAIAAIEAVDAAATVEADVVAAGLVSRMSRSRRPTPDAFAGAEETAPGPGSDPATGTAGSVPEGSSSVSETPTGNRAGDVPQDRGALLRLFSALKE